MSHADKRLPKLKEHILVYRVSNQARFHIEHVKNDKWNDEYRTVISGLTKEDSDYLNSVIYRNDVTEDELLKCRSILSRCSPATLSQFPETKDLYDSDLDEWKWNNAWRICMTASSSTVASEATMATSDNQYFDILRMPKGGATTGESGAQSVAYTVYVTAIGTM